LEIRDYFFATGGRFACKREKKIQVVRRIPVETDNNSTHNIILYNDLKYAAMNHFIPLFQLKNDLDFVHSNFSASFFNRIIVIPERKAKIPIKIHTLSKAKL
jgi:hypothetical protein